MWKSLKAQYWQESRLDPNARSPVGAEGVAQFMPATWTDAIRALNYPKTVSRRDADFAIEGGAWYMATLRRVWKRDRDPLQKHELAQASYNAGTGNILKAQKVCHDAKLWPDISPCLVSVTGKQFSHETITYVSRIRNYWQQMEMTP